MTKEWTKYKVTILKLYKDQSKTLEEVRRIMKDEYGFEASVRAYRSRFDKWQAHKYNIARRRSATATMAASYESPAKAGDISPLDCFQGPGTQTQLPWTRHCSAPDLPVVDGDVSLFQQQQQQHTLHSQIKPDAHSDDMSPVSSTFGHDPVEQQYCPFTVQENHEFKALVHRLARQEDGIVGVTQEQTMLGGGGQYAHHSQQDTSTYTELEWYLLTLQVPFQLAQLETLLHCLPFRRPDIHRPLTNGHTPFSYMADLFFDHVSSSSSSSSASSPSLSRSSSGSNHHESGAGAGDDPLLRTVGLCFNHFLAQGADPNTLVGGGSGSPLLFRLLDAPVATGAFGPLWNCVQNLAARAVPFRQEQHGRGNEPNALHVLFNSHDKHNHEQRNPGGFLAPDNGLTTSAAASTPMMTATEAQNRAHLTTMLIERLAALGRLDDRGPQGLSAFELYVRGPAAAAAAANTNTNTANAASREGGGGGAGRHFFFQVSAEFVRYGADTSSVVPRGFAGEVRAACQQQQQQQQQRTGAGTSTAGAAQLLLRLGSSSGGIAPWAVIWISTCQRRLAGDEAAVEDHLSVLQYCTKGGQAGAEALRALLPKPGPPPPPLLPPAVVLASPATTRSDFSEEGGNYTW